jgi:hypothetical protein
MATSHLHMYPRWRCWHGHGPTCHLAARTSPHFRELQFTCKKTPPKNPNVTKRDVTKPKKKKRRMACSPHTLTNDPPYLRPHFPASRNGNPHADEPPPSSQGQIGNSMCFANCLHEPPASLIPGRIAGANCVSS